jgi:hypothetical protein
MVNIGCAAINDVAGSVARPGHPSGAFSNVSEALFFPTRHGKVNTAP